MSIRLLALDIDGTLTANSENTISKNNLSAILKAQEAGVFVTIATGRSCLATRPIWDALSIVGPSIQYGGAWTVNVPDGELLDQCNLDSITARDLMRFARDIGVDAQLYVDDAIVVEHMNPFTEAYVSRNGMRVMEDPDIYDKLYENVPKVLAFSHPEDEERMRIQFEEAFGSRAHITRSQSTFIEINDRLATKGNALSRLAKLLGIQQHEVAAMGDSYLDIDMIKWAGMGVCMANSVEDVVRISDMVAPDCAQDGVAWFIQHYVL